MTTKDPMWNLYQGIELIREIQPLLRPLGYHVALAGGVLNKGDSDKDLDLVFVPLTNEERPDLMTLVNWLIDRWGRPFDNITDPVPCVSYRYQASFLVGAQRIDVFVV